MALTRVVECIVVLELQSLVLYLRSCPTSFMRNSAFFDGRKMYRARLKDRVQKVKRENMLTIFNIAARRMERKKNVFTFGPDLLSFRFLHAKCDLWRCRMIS